MANIFDYLDWRGDMPLSADPLNEVDNLVLSELVYTDFREIVPEDGHFALTAMFRDDALFQQYIDITLRNELKKDGNAEFFDLLLDVVVLQDGTPRVVDAEELESALFSEAITRDEYELAKRTVDKVVECWNANRALIEKKLYEYRALFGLKKKP